MRKELYATSIAVILTYEPQGQQKCLLPGRFTLKIGSAGIN